MKKISTWFWYSLLSCGLISPIPIFAAESFDCAPANTTLWLRLAQPSGLEDQFKMVRQKIGLTPTGSNIRLHPIYANLWSSTPLPKLADPGSWAEYGLGGDLQVFWFGSLINKRPIISLPIKQESRLTKALGDNRELAESNRDGTIYYTKEDNSCVVVKNRLLCGPDALLRECVGSIKNSSLSSNPYFQEVTSQRETHSGDLTLYFAFNRIFEELKPMINQIPENLANNPGVQLWFWMLEQVQSVGLSIGINEVGAKANFDVHFKKNSPLSNISFESSKPGEWARHLPKNAILAGMISIKPTTIKNIAEVLLKNQPDPLPIEPREKILKMLSEWGAVGEQTVALAFDWGEDSRPYLSLVYEVSDSATAQQLMGNFARYNQAMVELYTALKMPEAAEVLSKMKVGRELKMDGVTVRCFRYDLDLPPALQQLLNPAPSNVEP